MSEYQYYEFQAIDRPLTPEERAEVGSLSSRTHPTSTRAVFTYSYSDFRGDPIQVLGAYYDALLYMANWGSRWLAFRLPASLLPPERLAPYCIEDAISVTPYGTHVILHIEYHEEESFWIEGERWLSDLTPLRADLLRGDFRMLYLIWLHVMVGYDDDEVLEPPVPAGLGDLSLPLRRFADFFEISDDLLAVAASSSPPVAAAPEPDREGLVTRLSEAERTDWLVRLARGEPHLDMLFARRLREVASGTPASAASAPRRTVAELRRAIDARIRKREARKQKQAERARLQHLADVSQAAPQLWEEILPLIEQKQARAYDQAVDILKELHALARHEGELEAFYARVRRIAEQYAKRPALQRRLHEAGLLGNHVG